CGADLLALEEAGELNWRRRVILPFHRDRFRETSVTDRPGNWGPLYDYILNAIEPNDLLIEPAGRGTDNYEAVGLSILDEAARLAAACGSPQSAVLVWDSVDSGPGDLTYRFAATAKERGMDVLQ